MSFWVRDTGSPNISLSNKILVGLFLLNFTVDGVLAVCGPCYSSLSFLHQLTHDSIRLYIVIGDSDYISSIHPASVSPSQNH